MLVSICATTYKRPEGLKRLLEGLAKLTFEKVDRPDIEVIIVNNNNDGVAAKLCQEIQENFPWSLKTDVETKQGVTYGRNRSLRLAAPNTFAIAILDDDEVPVPNWLDELLWVQQEYQADVVTGTVSPYFNEEKPAKWLLKSGFFHPPRSKTGEVRDVAFTNNVLVKAEILKRYDPVFDNRFAFTGGEDAHLFMRIHKAGYKIVWADEAIVYDWFPSQRTKPKWVLERIRHMYSVYSLLESELYPSFKVKLIRIIKGLTLISLGILSLPFYIFLGKLGIFKSLTLIYKGTGTFMGLLGFNNQEYK